MFEKAESANSLPFAVPFHVGAYFRMGSYKRDVVVVIKMGGYIHGVLVLCGCLLSRFYGMAVYLTHSVLSQCQPFELAAVSKVMPTLRASL